MLSISFHHISWDIHCLSLSIHLNSSRAVGWGQSYKISQPVVVVLSSITEELSAQHLATSLGPCVGRAGCQSGLTDQGLTRVLSSFISEFYKNRDLAPALSCLLLADRTLIRKEVVVDLIKVFQWRVEEGGGHWGENRQDWRLKTGHYYFVLWHLTTSPGYHGTMHQWDWRKSNESMTTINLVPSTTDPLFVTTYMCCVLCVPVMLDLPALT